MTAGRTDGHAGGYLLEYMGYVDQCVDGDGGAIMQCAHLSVRVSAPLRRVAAPYGDAS